MHLNEIDIPNFKDYLKLNKLQREDIQASLAIYYGALRRKINCDLPIIEMIKEDLYELEEGEKYEACKLYLDTIEYIERFFREEVR